MPTPFDFALDVLIIDPTDLEQNIVAHMEPYARLLRNFRQLSRLKVDAEATYDSAFAMHYAVEEAAAPKATATSLKAKVNAHPVVAEAHKRLRILEIDLETLKLTLKALDVRGELLRTLNYARGQETRASGISSAIGERNKTRIATLREQQEG